MRRIADHPTARVVLLILAGAQAMIGAFIVGLAVNLGVSEVSSPAAVTPVNPGLLPLAAVYLAGIGGTPPSIVAAVDGSLWFAALNPPAIGRVDAGGNVSRYPTRVPWGPGTVAARPDGGVWYADPAGAAIGVCDVVGGDGPVRDRGRRLDPGRHRRARRERVVHLRNGRRWLDRSDDADRRGEPVPAPFAPA